MPGKSIFVTDDDLELPSDKFKEKVYLKYTGSNQMARKIRNTIRITDKSINITYRSGNVDQVKIKSQTHYNEVMRDANEMLKLGNVTNIDVVDAQ